MTGRQVFGRQGRVIGAGMVAYIWEMTLFIVYWRVNDKQKGQSPLTLILGKS
ncbi:MAG TPA: hypothetical protein P5114_01565 [Hyphomicrobiaceae bacterium]|nr:hypothetical protein [Hyphomicrobiaceae bacterium]